MTIKSITPPSPSTGRPAPITMEGQVRPPTLIALEEENNNHNNNDLPAYSVVDESDVLIPPPMMDQSVNNGTTTTAATAGTAISPAYYRQPTSSTPTSPAVETYLTAEQEKAQLRSSWFGADAVVVDGHGYAAHHPHPYPDNIIPTNFMSTPPHLQQQASSDAGSNPAGQNVPATTLSRGLQVPSFSRFVSSGFPYPDVLASYQITPADWTRFTSEITQAAQMTPADWAVAIGGGAGTFLVAGLVIAWWAAIPAYFVGRSLHRQRETENLARARNMGALEEKLLKWNQDFFAPKGILIRLDLPGESHDIGNMDVHSGKWSQCGKRWQDGGACKMNGIIDEKKLAKMQHKTEKKTEREARKSNKKEGKLKRKAIKKGRIVILPLNRSGDNRFPAAAATVIPDIGNLSVSGKTESDLYASSQV